MTLFLISRTFHVTCPEFVVITSCFSRNLLVAPAGWNDTRVSKVVFESSATGAEKEVLVKSLYMSLGPSMRSMKVLTPNSLFADSGNLLNHIMWAYGSSIVFMVKIDKTKVAENQIAKFRDHIVCKAGFRVSTRWIYSSLC